MRFHISDVLTVITGRYLSRDGMDGVYRILNFMTDDDIYTHQIPRALTACAPAIKEQFPHLADADTLWTDTNTAEGCAAWVAQFEPEYLEVQPLAIWKKRDPVAEVVEMTGSIERVIPFRVDDPTNKRN